jgi:hypothetical protein
VAASIIPPITFHDLRHTYASILAMKSVPLQVISAMLGHSDTRITHKHYAHLMPSYIAEVIREYLPDFGETEKSNVISITGQELITNIIKFNLLINNIFYKIIGCKLLYQQSGA